MPDKPVKPPGSITEPADKQNERISEISNVNSAISNMQKKVNQQIAETEAQVGSYEGIEDVQNSMIKVLSSLNDTVGSIGYGFAKVASETTKASADAVKQYGKAITEDISLDKKNVVAMALARSSPIFGYFAAKFVETDVFQSAKEKMKSNISEALGGVTSKFKEGMGGLIRRAKRAGEKEKPIKAVKPKEKVPKMQHGGYVERAGMAYLHPAEVVVPIEKILERIDESIGVAKDLSEISKRAQLSTLAKISTYVASSEKMQKVGIFKGFIRALSQVQSQYQEPANIRMLRAVLAIQDRLGATVGTWPQVWQKMLVEHPTFRQIAFAMRGLGAVFSLPYKFVYSVFKSRGGYQAHLSRSRNPFQAIGENIGLIYAEGMWRLDNIALYTRATAEATRDLSSAFTGKKYGPLEGIPSGLWSLFGLGASLTKFFTKNLTKLILGPLLGHREVKKFFGEIEDFRTKTQLLAYQVIDKLSPRRRLMREAYGGSVGLLPEGLEKEAIKVRALPVSEIHMERFAKRSEKYMIDNKKSQKKLLGHTTDLVKVGEEEYKVTKRMDRRERRRSIFGFFGGALGGIRSLLGGGLGAILPMITKVFLPWAGKTVVSLVGSVMGKIFPKGIATALTGLLTNPVMWAAISAAILGTVIGKMLDKLIGITPGYKKHLERMDEISRKASKEQTEITTGLYKRARGGGRRGYETAQELQLRGRFSATALERQKDVGSGKAHLLAIESAQLDYMNKNINEYMQYGPAQIESLRGKWLKEGGYAAKRWGYDPAKYGAEREAAFLKYLQAEGKPLTEMEKEASYQAYLYKYGEKYGIMDRVGGATMDMKALAKGGAERALAESKAITEKLKEQGEKFKEGAEKLGKGISTSVSNATTTMTSSVQNIQHVINNSIPRTKDLFSEYDQAVIRGDYMSEDF